MPVYEYKALTPKGKKTSGIIDADSLSAARQRLRGNGIYPIDIVEVPSAAKGRAGGATGGRPVSRAWSFHRVRPTELAMITRQLATLIGAGFPLVSGLEALELQTRSPSLKRILAQLKDAVRGGSGFADALGQYPSVFSDLYVNMVRAGETSGTLEIILEQLADISERQVALTGRIRTAMVYPVLMGFVGALVLFFLITYVVPHIASIFSDMKQTLPAPTRMLLATSAFFASYWWTLILAAAGLAFGYRMVSRRPAGRMAIDGILLATPGYGRLIRKVSVARVTRTLGSLLANGISMLPSMAIARSVSGNGRIDLALDNAAKEVEKGQALAQALDAQNAFPGLAVQMIQVGEQSGQLEAMLEKIAEFYEKEVETTVMRLTAMLEPVMVLIMGAVIGYIVVSICLPIFEMNQLIK